MNIQIETAVRHIRDFENGDLTDRLANLEVAFRGGNKALAQSICENQNMTVELLKSAFSIKKLAGQINVLIHGVAILLTLPKVLEEDERIEYLSLGAGNTGRQFDLETNKRVAEFKFITWRGADSVRQNSLFKDFYNLVEYDSPKTKCLYLTETKVPLLFLNGRRALKSVLKDNKLNELFFTKYGNRFSAVHEYYDHHKDKVSILDITKILPEVFASS